MSEAHSTFGASFVGVFMVVFLPTIQPCGQTEIAHSQIVTAASCWARNESGLQSDAVSIISSMKAEAMGKWVDVHYMNVHHTPKLTFE
jgi:hypothetical protein